MSPTVHRFPGLTSGEVYDQTQTDDSLNDGDVLVVEANESEGHGGIVGILVEAWPMVVSGIGLCPDQTNHQFHVTPSLCEFLDHAPQYAASVALAQETPLAG